LLLAAAQSSDAGEYRVRVSSAVSTGTGVVVVLRVAEPPVVKSVGVWTNGVVAVGALKEGGAAELRVEAEGGGELAYAWYRDGQPVTGEVGAGGTLRIAAVQASDAGQYQVEVSNVAGSVRSVPVSVEVASKPVIELASTVSVWAGETATLLGGVTSATAVTYQWQREVNGVFVNVPEETQESLVVAFATVADSGRYQLVARNEAGESAAVVRLEVSAVPDAGGGNGGGNSGGDSGGGGSGLAQGRWWVFEERALAGAESAVGDAVVYWIYDRVRQQSAWLSRESVGGEWKVSVWAAEDQQVTQMQKGGRNAKAGVLTFEVEGERPGLQDANVWDGFDLAGETGPDGVPEELVGTYGEGGDGTRRAITLRAGVEKMPVVNGFGELGLVLEWLTGAGKGD
jgi:hypothetical protein